MSHDPNCFRCSGTGTYYSSGDAHRSPGMIPCNCTEQEVKLTKKERIEVLEEQVRRIEKQLIEALANKAFDQNRILERLKVLEAPFKIQLSQGDFGTLRSIQVKLREMGEDKRPLNSNIFRSMAYDLELIMDKLAPEVK